jgi:hypothetical protein
VQGRADQACARNQIIARLLYNRKGEVSEACVRVIDSAAQSQYSSVDPRHSRGTVNGFTLHALRIAACRPPGHSQLRRLADFTHARHCKAWHLSLLHCYQHSIWRVCSALTSRHLYGAPEFVAALLTDDPRRRSHLSANFLFPSTIFAKASIPNFQKISIIHAIGRHNITNGLQ